MSRDHARLQGLIEGAAARGLTGAIVAPGGTYVLDEPLVWPEGSLKLGIGAPPISFRRPAIDEPVYIPWTTFVWQGIGKDRIFDLSQGTDKCFVHYARVEVLESVDSGIYLSDLGAGHTRSTRFWSRGTEWIGNDGKLLQAVYVKRTADGAKNDHHHFEQMFCDELGFAVGRLEGTAAVNLVFDHVVCKSGGFTDYGFYLKNDTANNNGAAADFRDVQLVDVVVTDFHLNSRVNHVALYGLTSESSSPHRFLVVEDPASGAFGSAMVNVFGGEWTSASSPSADSIGAAGEIIVAHSGALNIWGMNFGNQNYTGDYKFRYDPPAGEELSFNFCGCTVHTALAAGHFPGNAPTSKIGSYRRPSGGPTAAL